MDRFVPNLELIFEGEWLTPDAALPAGLKGKGHWGPIRAIEVGVVLSAIEEIYLASIRADLPPPDYRTRAGWAGEADPRSLTLRLQSVQMASPLHVVLAFPAVVYVPTFAAFSYGLAHVLGVPYRAATMFEHARERYFEQRVATAQAKDAWLDYKADQLARQTPLRLRAVDVARPTDQNGEDEGPIQPA